MRNPNQAGSAEQTGEVDANPPTVPHDTRAPRTRRSGLASRLGPRGPRPWPAEAPWAQEVADAVQAATEPADAELVRTEPTTAEGAQAVTVEPEPAAAEVVEAEGAAAPDLAEADDEADEDFAETFFWSSAADDGPARPWRSLFR